MGELRGSSNGSRYLVSFEARSTGEVILEASQTIAQPSFHSTAHCVIDASEVQSWADTATTIVVKNVARPRAPERIEYDGPALVESGCAIRVGRTVSATGSEFQVVVIELPPILTTSVVATVGRQDALAFIAKVRDAARAVMEMNPGLATTHADSARPDRMAADQPYFEFQVEKQVSAMPGNPSPRYPDLLRAASVEGEVLAQFNVDTTGHVELNSFKVLKSSHELFTRSVRDVLPLLRFYPATVGGQKVRQVVQMPFVFSLNRDAEALSASGAPPVNNDGFPGPGYLENISRQIALRFHPDMSKALRAEVLFVIDRDGMVQPSSIRLVTRSGVYSFDAEAQGAVESAAAARAFGALPAGYEGDSLPLTARFQADDVRVISSEAPKVAREPYYPPQPMSVL